MWSHGESLRLRSAGWSAAFLSLCVACGGEDDGTTPAPDSGAPTQNQNDDTPDGGDARDASSGSSSDIRDAGAGTADTGPADAGSGGSSSDTFFRADSIELAAPKLVAKPVLLPEQDITAQGQGILDDAISLDGDGDGKIDLSLLIRFLQTSNPSGGAGTVTTGGGLCGAPLAEPPACVDDTSFPFQDPGVSYANAQDCQLDGSTTTAAGACFVTETASLTMTLPILGKVPLRDAQVMGSWQGTRIVNGQVRGFLPKSVAQATRLPDVLPEYLAALTIQPGTPLTDFLSDGDLQAGSGGDQGWWFSVRFTAGPAKFQ